jgi:hypothetical protein
MKMLVERGPEIGLGFDMCNVYVDPQTTWSHLRLNRTGIIQDANTVRCTASAVNS